MKSEMERNLAAFKQLEAELMTEHAGRVALLHDGALVAIFNDDGDAYTIGCERFGLGHFSTQRIGATPRSLGFAADLALSMHGK